MEPIDLLDVDYVISINGTIIPPEEKRKVDRMFKIVIDGELFESKLGGGCGKCEIDTDRGCGIYAAKPFVCRTKAKPTIPIHLKRVSDGSN